MKTIHAKRISLFISVILISNVSILSQKLQQPDVTPKTPGAASVERYIGYPVDYSTGIPNISIPLYEVKSGDLTLPIVLSYHSSGLKPKEYSGWVGTGWSLNPEPSVSRSVNGLADDFVNSGTGVKGYFYNDKYGYTDAETRQKVVDGILDEQPDRYSYKLVGKSGVCYPQSPSHGWFVPVPQSNVYIYKGANHFEIKDDNGVTYMMGVNGTRGSHVECNQEWPNNIISRWLCTEMTSPKTKAKISFTYGGVYSKSPMFNLRDQLIIEDQFNDGGRTESKYIMKYQDFPNKMYRISIDGSLVYDYNGSHSFYEPNYASMPTLLERNIQTIYFDGGSVEFYADDYNLEKIQVLDKEKKVIRQIDVFVSKYNSESELTKLDSIKISAPDCETKTYRFEYLAEESVPPMRTKAIDHWGFYNREYRYIDQSNSFFAVPQGKTSAYASNGFSNNILVNNISIFGTNRESDSRYAKIGILTKITNSEGIETSFSYSGNKTVAYESQYRYWRDNDNRRNLFEFNVGGLRIDRIEENDPVSGIRYVKEYRYSTPTNMDESFLYWKDKPKADWGIVPHLVTTGDYLFTQYKKVLSGSLVSSRVRTWSSMPWSTITWNNGSPILYGKVTERIRMFNANKFNIVKNVYHYNVGTMRITDLLFWDSPKDYDIGPTTWHFSEAALRERVYYGDYNLTLQPYDEDMKESADYTDSYWYNIPDWQFGQLVKVENFKDDSILAAKTEYEYEVKRYDSPLIQKRRPYIRTLFLDNSGNVYKKDANRLEHEEIIDKRWYMKNGWAPKVKEISYQYDGGKEIKTIKDFTYESYQYDRIKSSKSKQVTDDSSEIVDQYGYEGNYTIYPETHKGQLFNFNMKAEPTEHMRIVGTDTTFTRMMYDGSRMSEIKTKTRPGRTFESRVVYNEYDDYGNYAQTTVDGNMPICYIWSYNNQHLIAKVENVTYANLLVALGNKDKTWIKNLGNKIRPMDSDMALINNLRSTLPSAMVSTYKYQPLIGVESITDPTGSTTYYRYDNFGRLLEAYLMEGSVKKVLQAYKYNLGDKR